jgi:hypothetical protein
MQPHADRTSAVVRERIDLVSPQRVYAVVDGAQCVELAYEAKIDYGKELRSLFQPQVETALWDVAPYLVPIDPGTDYIERCLGRRAKHACVLLLSAATEEILHEHLRRIFVVKDESGQEFFFRFYDPRVLRTFLPTCSREQLLEFFGPVEEFLGADAAGDVFSFRLERGTLIHESLVAREATARRYSS